MMNEPFNIVAAFALDLIIGDPAWLPHPVVIIGKLTSFSESLLNKGGKIFRRVGGILLVLLIVAMAAIIPYLLLSSLAKLSLQLSIIVNIFLCSLTIATKGLRQAALEVLHPLQKGNLDQARRMLARIVGRDTENLDKAGIIKATIESVAENCSDGIVAPLFYLALGGAPLAYAYKAINTLDSMIGYKNERYLHFGWAAARLDDAANFIPARITGLLFTIASLLLGKSWKNSFRMLLRDGKKHDSPNAGYPEAAMAGALGVQLGGPSVYQGEMEMKPYLGEPLNPVLVKHLTESIQLMTTASAIFLTLYLGISLPWIIIFTK